MYFLNYRYLITEFVSSFERDYITFLCPHRFSGAECQRTFFDVVSYVKKAFICEAKKQDSHCDLILAPYNEDNHWILFAIDLRAAVIYYLDPLSQQKPDSLSCAKFFDIAYKAYKARMKEESNLVFKLEQCASQGGGTECRYYVMKYMHEIVTAYKRGDLQQQPEWAEDLPRIAKMNWMRFENNGRSILD